MTIRYLDLADYLAIAAEVTGLDAVTITKVSNAHLADSAIHAPAAGFGDVDLYPEFLLKAAVLLVRTGLDSVTAGTAETWEGVASRTRPLRSGRVSVR